MLGNSLSQCFLLAAICSFTLRAQDVPASQIKGKQIITQAVAALGGERFLHMRTRISSGRVYAFFHDQLNGLDIAKIYTEYDSAKPARGLAVKEREVLGKKQDYSYLFLENQGFDVTFRGARPLPDENWDRYQRSTENDILYLLRFRLNEPGLQFDYVGSDVYVSTHVEIVDVTDAQDRTVRVYFDHNTLLPVRQSFTWMDQDTRQRNEEVTIFDKWRDAGDGVMWPFATERERNGYKTYESFANSVEINRPLPDKIFDLPAGAKILRKVN